MTYRKIITVRHDNHPKHINTLCEQMTRRVVSQVTSAQGSVQLYCVIQKDVLTSLSLYGLNSKRRLNTRQTVGCGIPSSLLALRVDLRGLRSKLS